MSIHHQLEECEAVDSLQMNVGAVYCSRRSARAEKKGGGGESRPGAPVT